jgi:hypothetical protein
MSFARAIAVPHECQRGWLGSARYAPPSPAGLCRCLASDCGLCEYGDLVLSCDSRHTPRHPFTDKSSPAYFANRVVVPPCPIVETVNRGTCSQSGKIARTLNATEQSEQHRFSPRVSASERTTISRLHRQRHFHWDCRRSVDSARPITVRSPN